MNTQQQVQQHLNFVNKVVEWLDEPRCFWQIHLIIRALGPKRVMAVLNETLLIQSKGGMLTKDGKRKRTLGGVFFYTAREQYKDILPKGALYSPIEKKKKKPVVQAPQPTPIKPQKQRRAVKSA